MRKTIYSFLTLAAFLLIAQVTNASHFRYGDISWRVDDNDATGRTIEFRVNTGWRCCPYVALNYGGNVPQTLTGTANGAEYYTGSTSYTFPSNGTYRVYYSGGAKIGNLQNNANGSWYVYTDVNVGTGNSSPVTSLPAIVNVQVGLPTATFFVPAADPDGDNLSFRLATQADGWPGTQPSGLSINSSTGEVTWDTQGKTISHLWNAAVIISDNNGSEILVDFIMQITQQSNPPQFDYSVTPADGFSYQTSPGQTISFPVEAFDTDPGSTVSMFAAGMPTGASVSPSFGTTGNPINHAFTWTPTASQFGQYLINFTAQDDNGVQVATSVAINVSLKPVFDVPPTPAAGAHNTVVSPGTPIQYTVQASDPDPLDVVRIVSIEGKSHMGLPMPIYAGATLTPLPTVAANPTSGVFNWTPTQAQWGHRHVYFTAEDSYGDQTVHEVSQLVNTPPNFTSSPVLTADVGQPYSYTINVNDPDLPYGDALSIFGITLPSWLSVTDNGNGTATLSGTPTTADAGNNSITIQAEDLHHHDDPRGVINQIFTLAVNNCSVNALAQNITIALDANGMASILQAATSNTILSEDFVADGFQTTSNPITNWNVLGAGIDVGNWIAAIPGHEVDLSAFNNGGIESAQSFSLQPGKTYTFTFEHIRNSTDDPFTVSVGSIVSQTFNSTASLQSETISFSVNATTSAKISFVQGGADDANGTFVGNIQLTENTPASLLIDAGSNATCGLVSITASQTNFDCSNVGSNSVTLVVTDINNNVDTASAMVTVVDNIAPSVSCPANYIMNTDSGKCGGTLDFTTAVLSYNPTGSQTNSTSVGFFSSSAGFVGGNLTSNGFFTQSNVGVLPVGPVSTSSAIDLAQYVSFTVDVPSGQYVSQITYDKQSYLGNGATKAAIRSSMDGFSSDLDLINVNPVGIERLGFDVSSLAGANGSIEFRIYFYAATGFDWNDLVSSDRGGQGVVVYVEDILNLSDNCNIASITFTGLSGADFYPVGTSSVSAQVTDASGNVANCSFDITVIDNEAPAVNTQNITLQLDVSGNASIATADVDNGSSDACGIASMSVSPSSFNCADVGTNTVTLTATDANGNTSSATATVTVEDNVAPTVIAQGITVQLDASGNASISASDVDNGSSDACGIASMSVSPSSFNCSNVGANMVTLIATDMNGNSSNATAVVTVEDNVAPAAIAQNITVQLNANGAASITAADIDNGSSDACGIASLSVSHSSFGCGETGVNPVILTVTDANGNVSTAMADVTVEDNILPTISCPQDLSVVAQPNDCNPQVFWSAPVANDNCTYTVSSSHNSGDRFDEGTTTVSYTITDASGNIASCSFDVTVNVTPLTLSLSSPTFVGGWNISCNGFSDGSIDALVGGGCLPYSYSWSNASNTEDVTGVTAGSYTLMVTDAKGRTISASIALLEPAPLTTAITASPQFTVSSGVNAYTIYLGYGTQTLNLATSTTGGTQAYSYSWLPAVGLNSTSSASVQASPVIPTTYTVTITDANGCSVSESFFIDVIDARCGKKMNKVLVCHKESKTKKGVTTVRYHNICVSANAVPAHLAHGDYLGPCVNGQAKKAIEMEEELGITVYPNPTVGVFNLRIHSHHEGEIKIDIFSMDGKLISELSGDVVDGNNEFQFDINNQPKGLYLVKVITGTEVTTTKLMKE